MEIFDKGFSHVTVIPTIVYAIIIAFSLQLASLLFFLDVQFTIWMVTIFSSRTVCFVGGYNASKIINQKYQEGT